jgi:hypothetical protein
MDVGNRPFNLKVYHNADSGQIKVFVDGQQVLETEQRFPSGSNYWKFGLYGVETTGEATVSNVQMYRRN